MSEERNNPDVEHWAAQIAGCDDCRDMPRTVDRHRMCGMHADAIATDLMLFYYTPALPGGEALAKCVECGKAHGGVCAACHCHTPDKGNHWHLFEVAKRSFCAMHCRDDWHHVVCREMTAAIMATKEGK